MADKTRLFTKMSGKSRLFLMIIALSGQFMTASTGATKLSPSSMSSQRQSVKHQQGQLTSILGQHSQKAQWQSISEPYSQKVQRQSTHGPLSDADSHTLLDLALYDAGQNPPAQDQPIRVKTELIDLRAAVTDKKGQPITDLRKEDFELMDNGKPQEVSFFSVVKIPGRGEARRTENSTANTAPGVTAGVTRPDETPGRTVVLYVDTLHLSPQNLLGVKQSLRKFIDERLTDQDLTAIVTSAGSLGVVEQFTRDRG